MPIKMLFICFVIYHIIVETVEYSTIGDPIEDTPCDIGFTFLVKTGIIINKIGLDYQIFKGNSSERARVVLYDSRLGSRVASATFVKEPLNGIKYYISLACDILNPVERVVNIFACCMV